LRIPWDEAFNSKIYKYHYRPGNLVELTSIGVSFTFDALYRRIPMWSPDLPAG
jgi:hypothetical protein